MTLFQVVSIYLPVISKFRETDFSEPELEVI